MTVLEKYGKRKFKLYSGVKFDIIVFDTYDWGKPNVLIKYKEYNRFDGAFIETTGGMGYSSNCGGNNESIYTLKNVFEEFISEIKIFIQNDKVLVSTSLSSFEFIDYNPTQTLLDSERLLELPRIRVVQHLAQFKDGSNKYIIIDKDKYDHSLPEIFYYGTLTEEL